jgi:ribonuclease BN (tRNA processing enzyme)
VKLTVIGCAGSYPGPDSPASCYLLEADHETSEGARTWRVLVDLGSGALGWLQRVIDPLSLDAVLFSHLHPDHCLDLTGYYVMRKYHPSGTQARLPVWGPKDTSRRMARAYDLPDDPGMGEEFDFRTYTEGLTIGPFEVEAVPVDHPVDAYGLRITCGGRTLAYTGDTGPCETLHRLAHDADLLLAEASFREADENPESIHLTGKDCGRLAAAANVRQLVITHVPPWFDPKDMLAEAQEAWDGPVELAVQGRVFEV